jgi:haloalkane dehalogenase
MHIATQQAERVAGLVLCNTWCWPASFGMKLFSWLMGGPIGHYLIKNYNLFANTFMKAALEYQSEQPQRILDAYTAPFPTAASRIGTWVFPREITQSSEWMGNIASRFHLLKNVPVEFVWGMQDPAFKHPAMRDTWRNHFPQGNWTLVDDASHFLQETAHQEISEAVLRVCRDK